MLYADWAWGKPSRVGVLRKTMQVQEAEENRITITGPFKMKSAGGDGTILTETLFCTHLGVSVPNHTLTMIGDGKDVPPETYESWGFVMGKHSMDCFPPCLVRGMEETYFSHPLFYFLIHQDL